MNSNSPQRPTKIRISEIFHSLQGEGALAGVPSTFVRIAGCPLRCRWCDSQYAWEPSAAADYDVAQLVQAVLQWPGRFVVITGGEPMVNRNLPDLAQRLTEHEKHITIETAGIAYIPGLTCDLMSISPKLSNSRPDDPKLAAIHDKARLDIAVLRKLVAGYNYQLKFVVDTPSDLAEIQQTVQQIGNVDSAKVMLMPQAKTRQELLAKSPMVAELCKNSGFAFCQRLHIMLWDGQRGK